MNELMRKQQRLALQRSLFEHIENAPGQEARRSADMDAIRTAYVEASLAGKNTFVKDVELYGRTEKGKPIRLAPWYRSLLRAIADFRIHETYTSGCAQFGKAQPLDSLLLTPSGWVRMGNVKVGDQVISVDGMACTVTGVFPQGVKPIFNVIMSDGSITQCCGQHLWLTQTEEDRCNMDLSRTGQLEHDWTKRGAISGTVKELSEIRQSLHCPISERREPVLNHSIPVVAPVQFKTQSVPLKPYLLGALLSGSGISGVSLTFTSRDNSIVERIRLELPDGATIIPKANDRPCVYCFPPSKTLPGYGHPLKQAIISLGLYGKSPSQKSIPDCYKYNSIEVRLAVLQGLIDTDGAVGKLNGEGCASISFASVSEQLVRDVRELVWSLGGTTGDVTNRVTPCFYGGEKRQIQQWRTTLQLPDGLSPFSMRKNCNFAKPTDAIHLLRFIADVQPAGEAECQCISVDHPSHLYVTDDYIVSHNTLAHQLFIVWCASVAKLNPSFIFATARARDSMIPRQFTPVADKWIIRMKDAGHKLNTKLDKRNLDTFQIEGANIIFSFAQTVASAAALRQGKATAGASVVSFQSDILILEERSQYEPGAAAPLFDRIAASEIYTKPVRELGTPGRGNGIERQIEQASHYFYPTAKCKCGHWQPLTPKGTDGNPGALLKPCDRLNSLGQQESAYLSTAGRPVNWWHHDAEDKLNSAYIACTKCEAELSFQAIANAEMRCIWDGTRLDDYLDNMPSTRMRRKIGIHISPLARQTPGVNIAQEIIEAGLTTDNTDNWQQQQLGEPSETVITGLTIPLIRPAIGAGIPPQRTGDKIVRLAGIDRGESTHYIWQCDYYVPVSYQRLSVTEVFERSLRNVRYVSEITTPEIPAKLLELEVEYGLIDNEPGREGAMRICSATKGILEIADQVPGQHEVFRSIFVQDGGVPFECRGIRNEKFLLSVHEGFLLRDKTDDKPLYRLPEGWGRWLNDQRSSSPIQHLMKPYKDPQTGKWKRTSDKCDDFFYAAMFCNAAFYIYINERLFGTNNDRHSLPTTTSMATY